MQTQPDQLDLVDEVPPPVEPRLDSIMKEEPGHAPAEEPKSKRNIVIIGGGVIGSTTAYFLTRHPKYDPATHKITLLEATTIASGASGKAGGLLGLWAYPKELVPLSFRLHKELADEHGGAERWGYRKLGCGSITATVTEADIPRPTTQLPPAISRSPTKTPPGANKPADEDFTGMAPLPIQSQAADDEGKEWEKLPKQDEAAAKLLTDSPLPPDLDWINGRLVRHYQEMGRPGFTETAQVHPFRFTTSIAALAADRGVDIVMGAKVLTIQRTKEKGVSSVEYLERRTNTTKTIGDLTDVVVCAGPWTGVLLPKTRVEGLRAHSVVWEAHVSPYAVFTDIQLPVGYVPEHRQKQGQARKHKRNVDPEIYARPGGEVYACGEPDRNIPLPDTADKVKFDETYCDDLLAYVATVSPALAAAPVKTKQACYLPRHMRFGEERAPLVGPTLVPGLYVASGHTCWGIQNGPATGFLMAEILLDGEARSADISKLDPRRCKV